MIELFVFLIYVNANEDAALLPAMVIGAATALLLPLLTYPYAKTIWIAMRRR